MDWNSDGEWDIISGDREGYLNVFIRTGDSLTAYLQYQDIHGAIIDIGQNSEPNVFDWNGDGNKDLVIGIQSNEVRVYLNQTSDTWPMFDNSLYSAVSAGGQRINLYRVNPYLFDLNQDGRLDLICGEQNGYVHYFENLGPDTAPEFAAGETLKLANGTPVRWARSANYAGSRCGFGDWNNDALPDFLMSTYEGQLEIYLGWRPTGVEEGRLMPRSKYVTVTPTLGKSPFQIACVTNRPSLAALGVWDRAGRQVKNLSRTTTGDEAVFVWDGTDDAGQAVSAGTYFLRLSAGGDCRTGTVILTR